MYEFQNIMVLSLKLNNHNLEKTAHGVREKSIPTINTYVSIFHSTNANIRGNTIKLAFQMAIIWRTIAETYIFGIKHVTNVYSLGVGYNLHKIYYICIVISLSVNTFLEHPVSTIF